MRGLFVVLVLALVLSAFPAFAVGGRQTEATVVWEAVDVCGQDLQERFIAKRGCCSKHQGVCGCRNGRVLCCDGTLSPTCTCLRDDEGLPN